MGRTSDWLALEAEGDRRLHADADDPQARPTRSRPRTTRLTAPIAIREEKLRVLLVESSPRWEYRYLRNALSRDPGVELSCLLFHPGLSKPGGGNKDYIKQFPAGLDELSKFDVVFLGDVGVDDGQLTAEQCRLIKGIVEHQASGLVFMPGSQGRQFSLLETELGDLCPVVMDAAQPGGWGSRTPNHFELTEIGRRSLLTKLADTRGRQRRGLGRAARLPVVCPGPARQGGHRGALAVHKDASQRLRPAAAPGHADLRGRQGALHGHRRRLAVAQGGRGQVPLPVLGPGGALDGLPAEHGQGRNHAAVLRARPAAVNQTLALHANVMDKSGEPLHRGDVTRGSRRRPARPSWSISRRPAMSGASSPADSTPRRRAATRCRSSASRPAPSWKPRSSSRAWRPNGPAAPPGPEVLEELARVTGGKVIEAGKLDQVVQSLAELPDPPPSVRRIPLWSSPVLGAALIALLGVFWVGRKVIGLV